MKLYTEEQVKDIMSKVFAEGVCFGATPLFRNKPFDDILQDFTPIELPSDEKIHKQATNYSNLYYEFRAGAKWVIDKIKNQ